MKVEQECDTTDPPAGGKLRARAAVRAKARAGPYLPLTSRWRRSTMRPTVRSRVAGWVSLGFS